jgi:transcriptional regulator with XRE-family HTH domain
LIEVSENDRLTGRQIAAARTLVGLSQTELATASNISVPTLRRMESSDGPASGYANNVAAVRRALEATGVEFTNGDRPGIRMDLLKILKDKVDLQDKVDEAVKLVADKAVLSEIDRIRAEPRTAKEEPEALLEVFARLKRQQQVLEAAGVEFTNGDQPGVRLRKGR